MVCRLSIEGVSIFRARLLFFQASQVLLRLIVSHVGGREIVGLLVDIVFVEGLNPLPFSVYMFFVAGHTNFKTTDTFQEYGQCIIKVRACLSVYV